MKVKKAWLAGASEATTGRNSTNLRFVEDSPEAVEQLESRDDLALHQGTCEQSSRRPPPRADGHLPEPRLQR